MNETKRQLLANNFGLFFWSKNARLSCCFLCQKLGTMFPFNSPRASSSLLFTNLIIISTRQKLSLLFFSFQKLARVLSPEIMPAPSPQLRHFHDRKMSEGRRLLANNCGLFSGRKMPDLVVVFFVKSWGLCFSSIHQELVQACCHLVDKLDHHINKTKAVRLG